MRLLCVIPARGGSKGIPRKNVADVCGRPLIAYTIASALEAGVFERVVVSTDDSEIAGAARSCGAEVPFLRPVQFATDVASPHLGVEYTVERLKQDAGYEAEGLVVLFPTHPFRTLGMVRSLAGLLPGHHTVKTVIPVYPGPLSYLAEERDGRLEPILTGDEQTLRETVHHVPAGTFYGVNFGHWRQTHRFIDRRNHSYRYYHHALTDPVEQIDIDTPGDLAVARAIISRGLYDFTATSCVP